MKRVVRFQATRFQAYVVLRVPYVPLPPDDYAVVREFTVWAQAFGTRQPPAPVLGWLLAAVPYAYPIASVDAYNAAREEFSTRARAAVGVLFPDGHWATARYYHVAYVAAATGDSEQDVLRRTGRATNWLPRTSVVSEYGVLPIIDEDASSWFHFYRTHLKTGLDFDRRVLEVVEERSAGVLRERAGGPKTLA